MARSINNADFTERIRSFLVDIKKAYRRSWRLCCKPLTSHNISRGRSHCISGIAEDLLAGVVWDTLSRKLPRLKVFVDMPLSQMGNTIYPDILICDEYDKSNRNCRILHIIEVKTNVGRMRDKIIAHRAFVKEMKKRYTRRMLMSSKGKVYAGVTPIQYSFSVDGDPTIDVVVCSSKNINSGDLEQAHKFINGSANENVRMFVLSSSELDARHKDETISFYGNDVTRWFERLMSVGGEK